MRAFGYEQAIYMLSTNTKTPFTRPEPNIRSQFESWKYLCDFTLCDFGLDADKWKSWFQENVVDVDDLIALDRAYFERGLKCLDAQSQNGHRPADNPNYMEIYESPEYLQPFKERFEAHLRSKQATRSE